MLFFFIINMDHYGRKKYKKDTLPSNSFQIFPNFSWIFF